MSQNSIVPSIKIIFHYNNEVLLLQEGDGWDLPGGRMEVGEHIMDCLHRELIEELGQDVEFITEPKLIRVYDYTPKADNVQRLYVYDSYQLNEKINFPSNQAKWLSIQEIKQLDIDISWRKMILGVIRN